MDACPPSLNFPQMLFGLFRDSCDGIMSVGVGGIIFRHLNFQTNEWKEIESIFPSKRSSRTKSDPQRVKGSSIGFWFWDRTRPLTITTLVYY